jgi:hypothetical protein
MQKNLYYKTQFSRSGKLQGWLLDSLMFFFSYPRLIMEVFLRRNMGERYFTISSAVLIGLLMFFAPIVLSGNVYVPWRVIIAQDWSYYLFVAVYAFMSYKRYQEIIRAPSVYDFKRFSLSQGNSLPVFTNLQISNKRITHRMVRIYLEPLTFFVPGLLLLGLHQIPLSALFLGCSVTYWFSTLIDFRKGDHFIMDKIDEIICNEELTDTFKKDQDVSPRGVPFYVKKPSSEELRSELANALLVDDDEAIAVF